MMHGAYSVKISTGVTKSAAEVCLTVGPSIFADMWQKLVKLHVITQTQENWPYKFCLSDLKYQYNGYK